MINPRWVAQRRVAQGTPRAKKRRPPPADVPAFPDDAPPDIPPRVADQRIRYRPLPRWAVWRNDHSTDCTCFSCVMLRFHGYR